MMDLVQISISTGHYFFFLSPKDALDAMKALGLNPGEQEMIDMTNEVNNNGLIYYPDFCKLVLRKYREESKGRDKKITSKP